MLIAYEMGGIMECKALGKRINMVRKDRGFTADRLSELCNINATYLRQIEGGTKVPSLPVFINICNALKISPDYMLRDALLLMNEPCDRGSRRKGMHDRGDAAPGTSPYKVSRFCGMSCIHRFPGNGQSP